MARRGVSEGQSPAVARRHLSGDCPWHGAVRRRRQRRLRALTQLWRRRWSPELHLLLEREQIEFAVRERLDAFRSRLRDALSERPRDLVDRPAAVAPAVDAPPHDADARPGLDDPRTSKYELRDDDRRHKDRRQKYEEHRRYEGAEELFAAGAIRVPVSRGLNGTRPNDSEIGKPRPDHIWKEQPSDLPNRAVRRLCCSRH
jgi:hypothetical protein